MSLAGGERLASRFEELRRRDGAALAILDADRQRRLSRDDLAGLVDEAARALRARRDDGRVLMLQIPNSAELIAAVLAAWRDGLVPVLLEEERKPMEADVLGRRLGASVRFEGIDVRPHRIPDIAEPATLPTGTALLKLTSGTTGEPRLVAVTGHALEKGAAQIFSTMGIVPEDRNLTTLPLAHSYAFDNVLLGLVLHGTAAVLVTDLVPRRLLTVAREAEATVWPAVPFLLDVLTRSAAAAEVGLRSLRLLISAGAPLPRDTRERFAASFGIRPRTFYGSTECGGIAFDREGDADFPDGCVGAPLDGVSLELEDAEDGAGRVRVRSASVGTQTVPEPTSDLDGETFLTADLGRIDERGRLHLLGRAVDFVKIGGRKVHPGEVERVIRAIPGVRDVAVVGDPRSRVNESLRALVVVEPGVDRGAIAAACERVLPAYKVPRHIELRSELPRTARGKLDRSRL